MKQKNLKSLPIDQFRAEIVNQVNNQSVTIITAETGAGKSTRVPQMLMSEGYSVVVTQPRRLAARNLAKRVAWEVGCQLGEEVGFRTAYERQDSSRTSCLFVTDGLALVRSLMGVRRHQVLIIDEVHEWNLNVETLVAWGKNQIDNGAKFKLVIMSATLEAEKLSAHFDGAPIISVPGRCYPVQEEEASGDMKTDIAKLLQGGRNVLAFMPGKAEISELVNDLNELKLNAEILPLHGDLEAEEQDRVFASYPRPKCVVATNVAQTSITIEDIDAVVDAGTEKRIELHDGVEGLYLRPISLADRTQRKGRAGRCREGIYIDCCEVDTAKRVDFPVPEIMRTRLDQTVLRLAEADIDAEELPFFHQPPVEQIHEAKRALRALGCLNEKGEVTKIGHQVARLPVSVQYGRMIVEAEKYGVVGDIIDIAAILEQGGVTARTIKVNGRNEDASHYWGLAFCPDESESDVMAQLAVFRGAQKMSNEERRANGVFVKAYHQARDRRRLLIDALKGKVSSLKGSGDRLNIMKAMCAGMVDHLYKRTSRGYINGDDTERLLARESIAQGNWIVGLPFDIQSRSGHVVRLVGSATTVDPLWLTEVAPQLTNIVDDVELKFDEEKDCCLSKRHFFFNDTLIKEEWVEAPEHPQSQAIFAKWLAEQLYWYSGVSSEVKEYNKAIIAKAEELNKRAAQKLFPFPSSRDEWRSFVDEIIGEASNLATLDSEKLRLPALDEALAAEVLANNPDSLQVSGEERQLFYTSETVYIRVEEEEIDSLRVEELVLPSGREVQLRCNGYTASLAETRARLRKEMTDKFKSEISSLICAPESQPFMYEEWCSWYLSSLGEVFLSDLKTFVDSLLPELSLDNWEDSKAKIEAKREELVPFWQQQFDSASSALEIVSAKLDTAHSLEEVSFVYEELESLSRQLSSARNKLAKANLAGLVDELKEMEDQINNLEPLYLKRRQEREELIKASKIPASLLEAFYDNVEDTLQFMANVAKIDVDRLDEHEICNCGRSRTRANCQMAWEAMGESSDFFCGADPNDVRWYITQECFCGYYEEEEVSDETNDTSLHQNNALFAALKKAGLV